jgi:hypothetical protein
VAADNISTVNRVRIRICLLRCNHFNRQSIRGTLPVPCIPPVTYTA